ncbi:tRNA-dihydrouridine synthase C [Apiospora saccharicola]|uniref:tRNA-dihydrouridine(16/17) synthase [NAD(P)(+)] n=1 Tax=Apiospora saccharicola TaxID=335842 RepID=A0ABR1WDI4_9PEZI
MFHARLFEETPKYRESHFQSTVSAEDPALHLDGNPAFDRPLFVQFCANDPDHLLAAARHAVPYCDAVDLNLGCPQGIARKGHYGAFLQEDQDLVFRLINNLHNNLPIPVTAKIRVLETKEQTLAYAQNVLNAGASIITVHGRRREQKGHLTGVADWSFIRYLRENLPKDTVIFANGNILQPGDIEKCLEATGADAVMSAEGNLSDPGIFGSAPPVGEEGREYWRGKDGRGGYRVDAVFRRYMNIMHKHVLQQEPPSRRPLFVTSDGDQTAWFQKNEENAADDAEEEEGPARKKRKKEGGGGGGKPKSCSDPNLLAMRPHLFHLLRHFVSKHTDIRDALARARPGDMAAFEDVLDKVERRVADGLVEYEKTDGQSVEADLAAVKAPPSVANGDKKPEETKKPEAEVESSKAETTTEDPDYDPESSVATVKQCKRPWWVVQPIVRPLPKEALAKGALSLSKKDKKKMEEEQKQQKLKAQNAAAAPMDSNKAAAEELPKPDGKEAIKEPTMDDKAPGLTSEELVCG